VRLSASIFVADPVREPSGPTVEYRTILMQHLVEAHKPLSGTGYLLDKAEIRATLTMEQLENLPPEVLGPVFGSLWIGETTSSPQVSTLTTARCSSWLTTACSRPPRASPSSARGAAGKLRKP